MAKKLAQTGDSDNLDNEQPVTDEAYAGFFAAEMKEAAKVMGRENLLVGTDAQSRKYGLRLPSLALQYVIGSDMFFMEHLMLLAGKPQSHKSSFAFEVARWTMAANGYARMYDTELKYSPGLAEQLMSGVCNERSWQVRTCVSADVWQKMFSTDLARYREAFGIGQKLKRGEKRLPLMPFTLIIDSLTGRTTEENINTFDKEGKASNTAGMRTAKQITDFLQVQNFMYMPVYVVMVRHEKDPTTTGGGWGAARAKQTPGGKAPDFIGAYDLRFAVIDKHRSHDSGYNLVRITCKKNAFNPGESKAVFRFSWQWADTDAGRVQTPKWEWDLATVEFIANFDLVGIKDICDITAAGSKANPTFSCKKLGMIAVSGQELGLAIRQDDKLVAALQDYLHILRGNVFDPHMARHD